MKIKTTATDREKFLWNMAGSLVNALSSMLLLSIVTRAAGSEKGGVFSLAYATAQLLSTVGCFETRVIQATDVNERYRFPTYFAFRFLTCALMMAGAAGYVLAAGLHGEKALVVLWICFYKAVDSLADSFQGLFQQKHRIDLSGRSLALRVSFCTAVFGIAVFATENLLFSSIAMVTAALLWYRFHDRAIGAYFAEVRMAFEARLLWRLFLEAAPLCIGSFMINYVLSAPRYAIDACWGDEIQSHFGFLMMPAFVINLFSLFVFRPLLTTLAESWVKEEYRVFRGIIAKCMLWVAFLTVGALAGSYLLGIPILQLFSGLELSRYRTDLMIIMFGGGLNAVIMLLYNVLAVMRLQYLVMAGYAAGFAGALVLAPYLVKRLAIRGAALAYVLPTAIIALVFAGIAFVNYQRKKGDSQ